MRSITSERSMVKAFPASVGVTPKSESKTSKEPEDGVFVVLPPTKSPSPPFIEEIVLDRETKEDQSSCLAALNATRSASFTGLRMMVARVSGVAGSVPPPLTTSTTVKHVYRFGLTAGINVNITGGFISGAIGGIASSSTIIRPWASTFRIRSITIYPSCLTTGTTGANISWSTGFSNYAKDEEVDTSVPSGVTMSSGLKYIPPKNTLCSMWLYGTAFASSNLFVLNVASGSIIDLSVEYTLSCGLPTSSLTVASAVAGQAYFLALDGPTNNKATPLGVPTTS